MVSRVCLKNQLIASGGCILERSSNDSRERKTPKGQSEGTGTPKDFATRQGLEPSTLRQPASYGDRDSYSEEKKTKSIGESSRGNDDITSDAGSRQRPESSQRRAGSGRKGELYLNAIQGRRELQGRLEWVDNESIPAYIPGRWEASKLKKIYADRATAAWKELAKGHPERIFRRLTGKIPNKELYRFFKQTDLKPGTYIDLGAGGGNFIPHVLGKLVGWDHPDMKVYAVERDNAAFKHLQDNVGKLVDGVPQSKGKIDAIKEDYTKGDFLKKFKETHENTDVSGILWANNGHYYAPDERVELMKQMKSMLKDDGKLLIVEYNTFKQHGPDGIYNKYPMSQKQLEIELKQAGFENVEFLRKLPSSDQYMMYSAIATAPKRLEDKDVS